jgi:uncharacterized membrane protein
VLSPTSATIRILLHVLAATIWVGGQISLGAIVGSVRSHAGATELGITKTIARAYNRVAWPAFAVLVITGLWNLAAVDVGDSSTSYQITVFAHILATAVSGVFAGIHIVGKTKLALALGGALGLLGALAALVLGVLLRTGS